MINDNNNIETLENVKHIFLIILVIHILVDIKEIWHELMILLTTSLNCNFRLTMLT